MVRQFFIFVLLFSCCGCATYQVGNQAFFRKDICTVHIPVFESDSFRKFLGERLTEAVIKEVESRSPYKVATLQTADSTLQGKILIDQKRVLIESRTDEARDVQVNLVVSVSWDDRYGRSLMKNGPIEITQFANFVPEGGQSMTTAQQEIIDKTARDIVSQMELPW
ncbi:MAG: LPS assembly lipoprotein LptE [Planctomycetota bacterium]|nr:LPS assembly lipoprotein LptE [Planctomycetota bacterium]